MENNCCPKVWEEYTKLDSAGHALRAEFLALRDETKDFRSVSREKVGQWRELHGKVKIFEGKLNNFSSNNFFMLYRAKEIMGDQLYGPEEIKNAFGFVVDKTKIPAIPYSPAELKEAEKLGERLVLRISEDSDGNPMTMEHLGKLAQARMDEDEGELLYVDWYKDEEFYKKSSLRTEWKLVGGDLLKDSTSKTYAEQTKVLRDYLKGIGTLTAAEESECSDENLVKISNDAQKLVELEINQKHRRSPGEVLYDWFLHFKKFKDGDYLEENYEWTNIVSSRGYLVTIGKIDLAGASVVETLYNFHHEFIGVVSVR